MSSRAVVSFCVCAVFAAGARAEPRGKDFFEHDYARGIRQDGGGGPVKERTPRPASETTNASAGSSVANPKVSTQTTPTNPQVAKATTRLQPWELPRVELYVNSADAAHLNTVVARALELHKKGRFFLIGISHIGDYRTLSADNSAEAKRLQIRYTATPSVVYGEHIKQSPTWAFVSEEGARLVEGCLDPERYIDTNGAEPVTTKLDAMNKEEDTLAGW